MDIAFDNMRNLSGMPNPVTSTFSVGDAALVNGKNLIRQSGGSFLNNNEPVFVFFAVPNSSQGGGVIDVVDISTGQRRDVNLYHDGVQSIPADGATLVMDYFRQ